MLSRIIAKLFILSILSNLLLTSCSSIKPPKATIKPHELKIHGKVLMDNYFWLREKENPDVIKYLNDENKYTEEITAKTKKLQDKIYSEIKSRLKETDLTVPVKIDDYLYYTRTFEGKQYEILCRKKDTKESNEEVLLDLNELARGSKYFDIGSYKVSVNHRFLAYTVDTNGSESYTLYIKDLDTNHTLSDKIENIGARIEWANDNFTLFYTTLDETKRPFKLFRHKMGMEQSNDVLVYEENDASFYLGISKSKDNEYLFITTGSITTSEVFTLKSSTPLQNFKLVHPREREMEYYLEHYNGKFFIQTNDNAKNFKIMTAPADNPEKKNWKEFIGPSDLIKIDEFDIFSEHLVVYERESGLQKIHVFNLKNNEKYHVEFPEAVYSYSKEQNPEFKTNILRFKYMSLTTPATIYDYNLDTKKLELRKQQEVLGNYNPQNYISERIFALSKDGTLVPISLVYKKGTEKNGRNPLLLYGYGSYGNSIDVYFSSNRISLLDRGFIFAIAHIRGGGEMGRYWYDQGKLKNKMNTFTDFIASAEHLIKNKYTNSKKLAILGGSAGGMLIGAVLNMRPDLFRVAVADVPFVDVLNTMLDPTLPLTVIEYEEWGNPNVKEDFEYMSKYSPYDNVGAYNYPSLLITAGLNDARVPYWEAAKWVSKLRINSKSKNPVLLKTNMGSGHMGESGRYDYIKEIAFEYAFILEQIN